MFANILSSKKEAVVGYDESRPCSVAVVFNRVSHSSLVAAVMYCIYLRGRGDEARMLDVRDAWVTGSADRYIWIDTQMLGTDAVTPKQVSARSMYINASKVDLDGFFIEDVNEYLPCTVVDAVFDRMVSLDCMDQAQRRVYNRIRLMARSFNHRMPSVSECCAYYRVIDHALEYYSNHTSEDFNESMLDPTRAEMQQFIAEQKEITAITKRRLSMTTLVGQNVFLVTDVDKSVYGTLRRLMFSGNQYAHLSVGTYGKYLQTSMVKEPNENWINKLEIFNR